MTFVSFSNEITKILTAIVKSSDLHAKWLNTLSFLENCGARKIAACEHPTLVKEEVLKHAAEEFRHAHYLKKQIGRVCDKKIESYLHSILGGVPALHYLTKLDLKTSIYLKDIGFDKSSIKELSYLFVTYAIELRAEELYPLYDGILRKTKSRVTVKSILLEEKEHLKEMVEGIEKIPLGFVHADYVCSIESQLCKKWLDEVARSI